MNNIYHFPNQKKYHTKNIQSKLHIQNVASDKYKHKNIYPRKIKVHAKENAFYHNMI